MSRLLDRPIRMYRNFYHQEIEYNDLRYPDYQYGNVDPVIIAHLEIPGGAGGLHYVATKPIQALVVRKTSVESDVDPKEKQEISVGKSRKNNLNASIRFTLQESKSPIYDHLDNLKNLKNVKEDNKINSYILTMEDNSKFNFNDDELGKIFQGYKLYKKRKVEKPLKEIPPVLNDDRPKLSAWKKDDRAYAAVVGEQTKEEYEKRQENILKIGAEKVKQDKEKREEISNSLKELYLYRKDKDLDPIKSINKKFYRKSHNAIEERLKLKLRDSLNIPKMNQLMNNILLDEQNIEDLEATFFKEISIFNKKTGKQGKKWYELQEKGSTTTRDANDIEDKRLLDLINKIDDNMLLRLVNLFDKYDQLYNNAKKYNQLLDDFRAKINNDNINVEDLEQNFNLLKLYKKEFDSKNGHSLKIIGFTS